MLLLNLQTRQSSMPEIWSPCRVPCPAFLRWEISKTRWFKVTFSSPSWRSLNHWKGSLNNPKKVTKNCQERVFFVVSKWPKWRFISLTCWSCCLEISSSNMPWVGIWNRTQEGIWAFFLLPLNLSSASPNLFIYIYIFRFQLQSHRMTKVIQYISLQKDKFWYEHILE